MAFQGNEHFSINHCIDNATHFSIVNYVSLSRMHKEDGEPGLSVWWVKKYDIGWVWRKQTFHKRDHDKPQWFIHQGWWTIESIECVLSVVTTSAFLFFVSLQQFSSPQITAKFLTLITTQMESLIIYSWKRNTWMALRIHIKHLSSCCKFLPIIKQYNIKCNWSSMSFITMLFFPFSGKAFSKTQRQELLRMQLKFLYWSQMEIPVTAIEIILLPHTTKRISFVLSLQ